MKVLCLNPPFKHEHGRFSRTSRSPAITKSGTIYYPIWLCYVAGVLEDAGHSVKVMDSCASKLDIDETLGLIKDWAPGMAVIDTSTPSIHSDINTAMLIKREVPDCFVVLMGTHPSALPDETLRLSALIDAVAVGEADYTIRDLAAALCSIGKKNIKHDNKDLRQILNSIDGLAFRTNGSIQVNKRRTLIDDLDALPFVSKVYKKHLNIKDYFFAASDFPEVQIMTARGCVARCTFCVYPQIMHGWKYRTRSPKNIADEFEWITKNIKTVREIGIEDDTFTGNQHRVIEFCKELLERGIRIKWYCNVRVDLKLDTMKWMKKAGCVLVTVGYESANARILKNIEKNITPQMILEFSKNTRKAGLLVHGCFMAGNVGDTVSTLEENLELAKRLGDDTMQFFPLMAYPGTKDYDRLKASGLLAVTDYSDYVTEDGNHNSVVRTQDMTAEELRAWCDTARKKYYMRLSYFFYRLIRLFRSPSDLRRTLKAVKRFIRFIT